MCCSCSCGDPDDPHGDRRNLTLDDIKGAAKAADITPEEAAENILGAVAKATKAADVACQVVKTSEERRYTLGVAYPANKPDVGKAADGFRDFAGPDVLEEAAWEFMRKGGRIGLNHAEGTEGHGTVVESYIWRGDPWVVKAADGSGVTVMPGDWLVGVQWQPETWEAIKRGEWNGFSPQGSARRRTPSPEALAALRRR